MSRPTRGVDADFTDLPLKSLADTALQRARELGAEHADLRVERVRRSDLRVRDARLAGAGDSTDAGLALRVVLDGTWGFSATAELTPRGAVAAAEQAVAMARVSRPLSTERVELAPEPAHCGEWVSSYDVDPFDVPVADQQAVLEQWSAQLLAAGVDHVDAEFGAVKEQKFYADLAGTHFVQQRVRVQPVVTVVVSSSEGMESMRTLAPPAGRGWEYVTGTAAQGV